MVDLINSTEKGCKWHFAPNPNFNVGPTDAAGQNFSGSWDSLIRECIQNSLDAVLDTSKPVVVKFDFKTMPMKNYGNFFHLKEHIQGCLEAFPDTAKDKYSPMLEIFKEIESTGAAKMPYLQVSDFNTKGMAYDENNDSCNFSAFVRGLGVHGGDQEAVGRGGSFGLGKSTIFTMSPFRTMLVSTYTSNNQYVFEGVSSLTTHKMNGQKWSHIGYYDNKGGMPITDPMEIPSRFIRKADDSGVTQSGTDIYIMGRGEEIGDTSEIIRNIILHYWLSIYKNKLVVLFKDYIIDKSNLSELMDFLFPSPVDNSKKNINPRPYYNAVINVDINSDCTCIKRSLPLLGDVELYLEKQRDAKSDRIACFRLPCMMVMRRSTSQLMLNIGNYGVYGSFVCVNSEGDKLLKELENPAHDLWSEKHWRMKPSNSIHPMANRVMSELREFLRTEIEAFCKKKGQATMKMLGAGKYLYTVQDMVEHDNDMDVDSNLDDYGIVSGTRFIDDETGAKGAEMSGEPSYESASPQNTMSGNVVDDKGGASTKSTQGSVTVLVTPPKKKKNKTDKKNKGGNNTTKAGLSNDKTASVIVPIEYKVYASEDNGHIVHNVSITTENDVESARIQFSAKREDGKYDKDIVIVSSDRGQINEMELIGVTLRGGEYNNMLKIQFNDYIKHSLIITVRLK